MAIAAQRLQDDPARDAVRDPGLDHHFGPGMQDRAPYRAAQGAVRVAVTAVRTAAKAEPRSRQHGTDVRYQLVGQQGLRARPGRAEQAVEMFLPGLVYVIMLLGRSSLYDQAG